MLFSSITFSASLTRKPTKMQQVFLGGEYVLAQGAPRLQLQFHIAPTGILHGGSLRLGSGSELERLLLFMILIITAVIYLVCNTYHFLSAIQAIPMHLFKSSMYRHPDLQGYLRKRVMEATMNCCQFTSAGYVPH